MKAMHRLLLCCALVSVSCGSLPIKAQEANAQGNAPQDAQGDAPRKMKQWGEETLAQIHRDLFLPKRGLYADAAEVGKPLEDHPAFMWGCGVQLAALVSATRLNTARFRPELDAYVRALDPYWIQGNGVGGYDVMPDPPSLDRYYDDNEWIVLDYCDAYEVTRDPVYLKRAEQVFRFVMSGEDDTLGGGIYWHEQDRSSKNTCSNAPAATAALRLYRLSHRKEYLQIGKRLVAWTQQHLQDTDGLYFDNIRESGAAGKREVKIEKMKWSYNTALMIRADVQMYEATREKGWLEEAKRVAHAAIVHWVKPETGGMSDGGPFAHLLCGALLDLAAVDTDPLWRDTVTRALTFLHDKVKDANGRYLTRWDTPTQAPVSKYSLLDQASVARAYLQAAE